MKDTENLTVGTVVMVIDQRLPSALWPMGWVTKIIRSADGKVETAMVQVDEKTYIKSVAKLSELPAITGDTRRQPCGQLSLSGANSHRGQL